MVTLGEVLSLEASSSATIGSPGFIGLLIARKCICGKCVP